MQIKGIKTHKITRKDKNLLQILDTYVPSVRENSVLVVASKIVAICEGRVIKAGTVDKDDLVANEAEWYLPRSMNKYDFCISIKHKTLTASAGIDESNGNGYFVLWPSDPQKSADSIRVYLSKKHSIHHVGVIISDSKTTPLRWGVTGVSLAHSGFRALNSYVGKPDIFGRLMHAEKLNVADTLATAAVGVMGEGEEQTPLAIIEDIPFTVFQNRNPSKKELRSLRIALGDDIYAPLLKGVEWQKGKAKETD